MLYNKNYFLVILFFILSLCVKSQTIEITGKIVNGKTDESLPFVNIQIKNSNYGTISNRNGYFKLKIPYKYENNKILFSYIGFQTKEFLIKGKKWFNVILNPIDTEIGEIIIMPDSTLLTLLEKAFKKIPENYPTVPTKLKGFYRETKKSKNQYLYFAEAVTETFKTGYQKAKNDGQVRIIKSLVNKLPYADTISPVKFYGGVFMPTLIDFVYRKISFINPKNFKEYNYSLNGTSVYQNRPVYIISFDTKNDTLKGLYKGKFYLDKESLAYVACDYKHTQRGLDRNNGANPFSNFKRKKRNTKVFYFKFKGKWHLKYIQRKSNSIDGKFNNEVLESDEFITTEIFTENVKPIPFNERLKISDIFTEKANERYDENYWDDYNTLYQDTLLKNQIKTIYTPDESKKILTKKNTQPKEKRMYRIMKKIGFDIGVSYLPLSCESSTYSGNYMTNTYEINFSSSKSSFDYRIGINMGVFYRLSKRWEFIFSVISSPTGNYTSDTYDIGTACNFTLNNTGRPFGIKLSLMYSFNDFSNVFMIENTQTFSVNNKSFDASKIQLGIGKSIQAIKPTFSINQKIGNFFSLYISSSYLYPVSSKDMFYIREASGFYFTRKSTKVNLEDESIALKINDIETKQSNLDVGDFLFSIGFIIKI